MLEYEPITPDFSLGEARCHALGFSPDKLWVVARIRVTNERMFPHHSIEHQ